MPRRRGGLVGGWEETSDMAWVGVWEFNVHDGEQGRKDGITSDEEEGRYMESASIKGVHAPKLARHHAV